MRKVLCVPECIGLIGNINARTSQALSHCPHIAPRQSPGQSGSAATATLSHGDNTPKPNHQMTPHSRGWLGSGDRRPYWLLEMFRFGGFQAPTDALESPRVLPYILKVSKDILIIRISGNQFVSQARHHMALLPKYHALYLVPAPTQDNKADGEHFGACTRRRDLN